jgi:hypothetical protein
MFDRFLNARVGDLLDAFGLTLADLVLLDEPPGQLSSFSFQLGEDTQRHWVRISIQAIPELFSPKSTWEFSALCEATVIRIREGHDLLCIRAWHPSKVDHM